MNLLADCSLISMILSPYPQRRHSAFGVQKSKRRTSWERHFCTLTASLGKGWANGILIFILPRLVRRKSNGQAFPSFSLSTRDKDITSLKAPRVQSIIVILTLSNPNGRPEIYYPIFLNPRLCQSTSKGFFDFDFATIEIKGRAAGEIF